MEMPEFGSEVLPDILTRENQEKFRRKISIASRAIAILLICSIVFIGFVQIRYSKEVLSIKDKYGSLGYCYLCGKESLRKCECQYIPQLQQATTNITIIAEQTAENNILPCPDKNSLAYKNNISINFSSLQAG
jgi:hypothetical protein